MSRRRRKQMTDEELVERFEARFGHRFGDASLLVRAVTHTSFAEENEGARDNQRLEFLGDAVVGLVVTSELFRAHPGASEGVMSKMKGRLVSTRSLAAASAAHDLGDWLRLGRGEESTDGRVKKRLLADVFESVTGALFLDGGFDVARAWVLEMFEARLAEATPESVGLDFKSELQERIQGERKLRPEYATVQVVGPGHEQEFTMSVSVDGRELGRGTGRSKKEAQQAAARAALQALTAASGGSMEGADVGSTRPAEDPAESQSGASPSDAPISTGNE